MAEVALRLAVRMAVLLTVTADAEAMKVAVEAPAPTVTEAGVVTKVLLSERVTTAPPAGAGAFNVAVQVAAPLPVSADGVQVNEDT